MISRENGALALDNARAVTLPEFQKHFSAASMVEWVHTHKPKLPVSVVRLEQVEDLAACFVAGFNGDAMYAVKCNPDPEVLRAIWHGGIRRFDVASLGEVDLVSRTLPDAELFFMHPIKSREAICEAYFTYGVRNFVLDMEDELQKILQETNYARDLNLFVRLALPKHEGATLSLTGKFGAEAEDTPCLLQQTREYVQQLGVTFHVGSQCMDPASYGQAIDYAAKLIRASGVVVDAMDVGGGFPASYPGLIPPPDEEYFREIDAAILRNRFCDMKIYAEPGRKLVAEAGALVVRVEARRGDILYLNDGVFGGLWDMSEAGKFPFPMRHIGAGFRKAESLAAFRFAGPTCDSYDMMEGAFILPDNVAEGDWIILDCMGGYSDTFRTSFNSFADYLKIYL